MELQMYKYFPLVRRAFRDERGFPQNPQMTFGDVCRFYANVGF